MLRVVHKMLKSTDLPHPSVHYKQTQDQLISLIRTPSARTTCTDSSAPAGFQSLKTACSSLVDPAVNLSLNDQCQRAALDLEQPLKS